MISEAVTPPTDHIKGITDRNESEKWAQDLIKDARKNPVQGKEHLALYTFANATDLDGELLPVETAAVELLNIIRPTVALTVWVALIDRKSTRLNSSHVAISYAAFCLE